MESSVKASVTPSVAKRATDCLTRLASVSVRMRLKSSTVSGAQLDPDREAALQFRQEVGRLRDVEGAGGDEQDVVGLDRAVLGRDRRALDQGQEVALHALARHVAADAPVPGRDLVDLVEEDDAVVLDLADRLLHERVLVEQLVGFLGDERLVGLAHADAPGLGFAAERLAEHVAEIDRPDGGARQAGDLEHRQSAAAGLHLDLDLLVVELVGAQLLAERLARGGAGCRPDERIEHALLGGEMRPRLDLPALVLLDEADADLDEVAHDLLDVAPDIADFRELGRLHLEERGAGETGETAGDLRLAAAGRADHQDVLRQNLLLHGAFELLPPPAVAQRDGDGALGVVLADDVAVELGDDFARGEGGHSELSSSSRAGEARPGTSIRMRRQSGWRSSGLRRRFARG